MTTLLLVLQIFIIILLTALILLQKSKSGSFISGNTNSYISEKAYSSFITKFTMFLAVIFMANSLVLAKIEVNKNLSVKSLIKSLEIKKEQPKDKIKLNKDMEAPKAE